MTVQCQFAINTRLAYALIASIIRIKFYFKVHSIFPFIKEKISKTPGAFYIKCTKYFEVILTYIFNLLIFL